MLSLWCGGNCRVFVAASGLHVSRLRFCCQAQHLVMRGVCVGGFVLGAVLGRCGLFRAVAGLFLAGTVVCCVELELFYKL